MPQTTGSITQKPFGKTQDGVAVGIFTLRNSAGAETRITNYGGIVVSLSVPDRNGQFGDVVLGCDTLEGYFPNAPYLGALIGRHGNRIGNGTFSLDGRTYTLAQNNGTNSLHGGLKGFDKVVWDAKPVTGPNEPALDLNYTSRDGEEGFPGTLKVNARYTLTDDNALRLDFTATTDKPTIVNLTHHSYFNLAGKGDVLDHEMMIAANTFTPVTEKLIPTGELRLVKGTPLDFSVPTKIGARIDADDEQIRFGGGYDHNYVLNKLAGQPGLAARVYEASSGREMEAWTTAPGVQFYSGNFLDGSITGKSGQPIQRRAGFCLEPQFFPDSPNQPTFPSPVLRPGEKYKHTIIYRFKIKG